MASPSAKPQTALVTGATSGIGHELARLFAQDGINLVLVARQQAALDAVKADFEPRYRIRVTCLAADLSQPGQAADVYGRCQQQGIQPDYVVNNAGFGSFKNVAEEDPQLYAQMLTLNVETLTALSTLAARDMVARGSGRILNVASTSAFQPVPHMAVYGASKAYVLNFTEALHAELKGTGATATVFCPGVTRTAFLDRANMNQWATAQGRAATPAAVAQAGYRAMRQGRLIVIPGLRNKVLAFGISLIPFQRLKLAMSSAFMRAGQ